LVHEGAFGWCAVVEVNGGTQLGSSLVWGFSSSFSSSLHRSLIVVAVSEMNRSFIAPESKMQDAFKLRQQQLGALRSSVRAKERDEELALFLEMRSREKAERGDLMLRAAEDFDGAAALGMNTVDNTFFFFVISFC